MEAKRILMALFAIMLITNSAKAEWISGSCGEKATYTFDTQTGHLSINGTGDMADYSWAPPYTPWVDYRDNIKTVFIASGITRIGGYAFYDCSNLTSVIIPNSVNTLGNNAFNSCESLSTIEIPNSITQIDVATFAHCSSLTSITLPESITTIDRKAFAYCSSLAFIIIPNSVTSIGRYAFDDCSGLTSVTIGKSLTSIEENVFTDCTNVKELIYADGCDEVLRTYLTSITTVTIPNTVRTIRQQAFENCSGLTSITLPNSIETIGSGAFLNCSGLTSVNLPTSITRIDDTMFYGCTSLTSVTIPSSVTRISGGAFYGCTNLKEISCLAVNPPTVSSSSFENVNKTACKVYVPTGSKSMYASAEGWTDFKNILEQESMDQYDLNKDGKVDINDVTFLIKKILNQNTPSGTETNKLVGIWRTDYGKQYSILCFNADGTGYSQDNDNAKRAFYYTYDDKESKITLVKEVNHEEVLKIDWIDDKTFVLHKTYDSYTFKKQ